MSASLVQSILVTGASGVIGVHLCRYLESLGYEVIRLARKSQGSVIDVVGDVRTITAKDLARFNPEIVVHCAAVKTSSLFNSNLDLIDINVQGAANMARVSAAIGVKKFIFISSVKSMAEYTNAGEILTVKSPLRPSSVYGRSKATAEVLLQRIVSGTGMDLVILRPAMVYSREPVGAISLCLKVIDLGLPIPLDNVSSLRSMVSLDNLVEAVAHCAVSRAVSSGCYLISDGSPISISEIIGLLIKYRGSRSILFEPRPVSLELAFSILGLRSSAQRLFKGFEVDISSTISELGWCPSHTTLEGFGNYYG